MLEKELINGFYFITTGPFQKTMIEESVHNVNKMLDDAFKESAPGFGGILARAYVTISPYKDGPKMLSLIFTTTIGGKNDFFLKNRLDFVEELFENIFDTKFTETVIQTPKENQREVLQ